MSAGLLIIQKATRYKCEWQRRNTYLTRKETTMTTAEIIEERRVVPYPSSQITVKECQRGVHVHLFGINENMQVISALILKRASNKKFGIISGKAKPGERLISTAYREISEEIGLIPLALFDTGRKQTIQCKKFDFHVSVFSGIIPNNSPIKLNHENTDYAYVPTVFSLCHIDITDQRRNQIFCINKTREMYHKMMN